MIKKADNAPKPNARSRTIRLIKNFIQFIRTPNCANIRGPKKTHSYRFGKIEASYRISRYIAIVYFVIDSAKVEIKH